MKCERCGEWCSKGNVSWWCDRCPWWRFFTDDEMADELEGRHE